MSEPEDLTESQIFRYVRWCMDRRVPNIVAAVPLIVGFTCPVVLPFWLGWWGLPLAVIGFAGNGMLIDFASRAVRGLR